MRRLLIALALIGLAGDGRAAPPAAEREVAALELGGKPPLELSVVRQRLPDGGLKLRLLVSEKGGKKPASAVLYEGGGDDDGPGDKAFRGATIEPYPLPGGKRGVRVDFEFQVPGSKKHRQVDTYLASIDGAPRLVLDATTRRERDRSKACHEVEQATLAQDKEGRLFVRPTSALESELNDDDLPIDKGCKGKQAGRQVTYKFDGETFLQIDPPPAPAKKKAAEEADDD